MDNTETVELTTYGTSGEGITFGVPKKWLIPVIEKYGYQYTDEFSFIDSFLSEYTWDLSFEIYREAQEQKAAILEERCLSCGHEQAIVPGKNVWKDILGVFTVCDECKSSFEINIPIFSVEHVEKTPLI